MIELFEYVFFTPWLTLWINWDVKSLLCFIHIVALDVD